MCQQDVCPATLYTRTTDPRPHKSEAQQPLSLPPVRAGPQGKSSEMPANHTHPTPTIPAGFALPSPLGCRGWPHSTHNQRRRAQRANLLDCCTTESSMHVSEVSFQPLSPQGHRGGGLVRRGRAGGWWWLVIFNITNMPRLELDQT